MRWLHGIRQDKRLTSEKSPEELAFDGGRISLTFRQIGTFLSKDQSQIWGQGATSKFKAQAKTVINGDNAESEKMIRAFGKENHASEFDWKEQYGEGFDVLHIENSQKLFLSGDKVADLRVKIMLAEYGIEWSEGKVSPAFHWKGGNSSKEAPPVPESLPVRFVDNDLSKSAIVGDVAIMLYLDAVYGSKSTKSNTDLARTFTLLQQSGELLKKWRDKQFSVKRFRKEMELWDAFAAEGHFIVGEKISLADYAIWPLLEEIQTEWDGFGGLRKLAAYYTRLKGSTAFVKALGVGDEKQAESKVEQLPKMKEGTESGPIKDSDGKMDDKKDKRRAEARCEG
jgi:glutathione S-transferase